MVDNTVVFLPISWKLEGGYIFLKVYFLTVAVVSRYKIQICIEIYSFVQLSTSNGLRIKSVGELMMASLIFSSEFNLALEPLLNK